MNDKEIQLFGLRNKVWILERDNPEKYKKIIEETKKKIKELENEKPR